MAEFKTITVSFQIPGEHQWITAPECYDKANFYHDHTFYIEVDMEVTYTEGEDITFLQHVVERESMNYFAEWGDCNRRIDFGIICCETIARHIRDIVSSATALIPEDVVVRRVSCQADNIQGSNIIWGRTDEQ